jgi:hypothetical protein
MSLDDASFPLSHLARCLFLMPACLTTSNTCDPAGGCRLQPVSGDVSGVAGWARAICAWSCISGIAAGIVPWCGVRRSTSQVRGCICLMKHRCMETQGCCSHLHATGAQQRSITAARCGCRQIPGYPRVDMDNSFLASRFDGSILDAKAWGTGRETPNTTWPLESRNMAEAALCHLEVSCFACCVSTPTPGVFVDGTAASLTVENL